MQEMFETLRQQGQLKEQTTQQLYSEAASTFLADRFVSGTCPNADCSYEVGRKGARLQPLSRSVGRGP